MNKKMSGTVVLVVTLGMVLAGALEAQDQSPARRTERVLLLISDIGSGHASAARSIEEQVKRRDASVTVDTRNIRDFDFTSARAEQRDRSLYWFVVKRYPRLFTRLYNAKMNKGSTIPNLAGMLHTDLAALGKAIKGGGYDVVVAAHYGAATALSVLRERGELQGVRTGWLNTDYVVEYFPRFAVDKFFLGHESLAREFTSAGVSPDRVAVTGIPVSERFGQDFDAASFMKDAGLDPNVKTVVMSAGAEGVADFERMARELARTDQPLQVVAITGRNAAQLDRLRALSLPANVKLVVEGFIPLDKVVGYVRSASLYVTKSGGLMPTEAFTAGVPTILLDVYGGHESVNAKLFLKEGMADVVGLDYAGFGEKATALLEDEGKRRAMLDAQARFRTSQQFDQIAEFIMNPNDRYLAFGGVDGEPAAGAAEAVAELDAKRPGVELLLSYAQGKTSRTDTNFFGHLGLRVGDTVYTANHVAEWGKDQDLMHRTDLGTYLYGVTRDVESLDYTSSFAEAYGRTVLGLRVHGVGEAEQRAIMDEFERVQLEWRRGTLKWQAKDNNCADLVVRGLKAGGVDVAGAGVTLPLTVYERFLKSMADRYPGRLEVVKYEKVPGAVSTYKFEMFPLNLKAVLGGGPASAERAHEQLVSKVVRYDVEAGALTVERTGRGLSTEALDQVEERNRALLEQAGRLAAQEERVAELHRQAVAARAGYERAVAQLQAKGHTAEDLEAARAGAKAVDAATRAYFDSYDETSRAKNELAMELVRNDLGGLVAMAKGQPRTDAGRLAKLEERYRALVETQRRYYATRHQEGVTPGDGRPGNRISSIRSFERQARELGQDLSLLVTQASWAERVKVAFRRLAARAGAALGMVASLVRTAPDVARMASALAKPSPDKDLGVAIRDWWAKLGEKSALDVTVERLGAPAADRPIVYVLSHRQTYSDHMAAYGALEGQAVTFVTQADAYGAPDQVRRAMNANPAIAPVGSPAINPVERIAGAVADGRNVVVYPEGSVPTPLGETRPLKPRFSSDLLPELLKGRAFQVVPVTIADGAVRYGETFDPMATERKMKVVLHEPIPSERLALDASLCPSQDLAARLVRLTWHEDLTRVGEPMAGQMPVRELVERVRGSYAGTPQATWVREQAAPEATRASATRAPSLEGDLMADLNVTGEAPAAVSEGMERATLEQVLTRLQQDVTRLELAGDSEAAQRASAVVQELGASLARGELPSVPEVREQLASVPRLGAERVEQLLRSGGVNATLEDRARRNERRVRTTL